MNRALFCLLASLLSLHAQETLRQASEARLWLKVPAGSPPLRDVHVSSGNASSAAWEKDPAVRERHTDVVFPIRWWTWNEITIVFTPQYDGDVELTLSGPWAKDSNGKIFHQEILWDEISAQGADLQNGGFENSSNSLPDAWKSPWKEYPSSDSWPLSTAQPLFEKHLACSFHDRPLVQNIAVRKNTKVSLKLHAKAATLPDFIAPKPLGSDTPAHRAAAHLKRGMNLSNCWDAPPPYSWGIRYSVKDVDHIADEGFDHIRVPVAWHFHLKPGDRGLEISPALLADLEPVLRRALEKNLYVMLDWHHFNDLTKSPNENAARFTAGWQAIANHFKSWPPTLFLELLNEPCDALTTEVVNPIYKKTINAIRAIDPKRILVISPGQWGQVGELDKLRLPDSDDSIIVTVHCYEPFHFTHQGAGWVGLQDLKGIVYPGPPQTPYQIPDPLKDNAGVRSFVEDYNTLPSAQNPSSPRKVRAILEAAREWSLHFGRPIHLGEFGSDDFGDHDSRARYLRDVRTIAEANGIPWALWDWKAGFSYWDSKKNQPIFRSSLFD